MIIDTITTGFDNAIGRLFNTATDLAQAKLETAKDTKAANVPVPPKTDWMTVIKANWIILAVIGIGAILLMRRR